MAVSNIPEKINNFNIYNSGNILVGITDEVTLPSFEAMTETISGPGILGEIESPHIGHFGSMTIEIPFRVLYGDIFKVMKADEGVDITLRGAVQVQSLNSGKAFKGMRIVMRGMLKTLTAGSAKAGSPMSSSVTLELVYIMIEVDGAKKVELDKLNNVYNINGTDYLAKIKSLC